MMASQRIRILLIDDHAMLRQGLRLSLNLQPDMIVVGEAGSGREGVELAQCLQPTIVLLDLNMPDMDGVEVFHLIRQRSPDTRVLVLSGIHADARVFATVEAGVDGYIVKDASTTELMEAIRTVASGQCYYHPLINRAISNYVGGGEHPAAVDNRLTPRELMVLQLIATSATNKDIAAQLHVSEETVRTHVKNILRKLNQPTRTQAVFEGIRRGLISID